MRKKSYAELRAEGLCTKCGKPNPTPERSMCPTCAERNRKNRKDNREYLKKIGVCVRCGKNHAEPNKTLCYECIGKESDKYYAQGKSDNARKNDRERKRIAAKQRLQSGICPRCGKRKSVDGGLCNACRAKAKRYRDAHRNDISRSERPEYGRCYICGEKIMDGKRVCERCYQTRLSTMPAMWENMNNEYFKNLETARIAQIKGRNNFFMQKTH